MYQIQYFDYEEGTAARWYDLLGARFDTEAEARNRIKELRADDRSEESMYSYRVAEVGSAKYYSQPTDRLEY